MPSTIISRTFNAIQDNRAVLNNSNFVRPFNAGNWNKIRICIRYSITDPGVGSFVQPANLAVGICSGVGGAFIGNTQQFIGASVNIGTAGQTVGMARANPGVNPASYIVGCRLFIARKIGSLLTGANEIITSDPNTFFANTCLRQVDGLGITPGPKRSLMFVEITRPGTSTTPTAGYYLVSMFYQTTIGNLDYDASIGDFQTQAIAAVPALTEHAIYNPAAGVTGNETGLGTLDHVCCAWNNTKCNVEISDVGFVKLL